MNDNNTTFEVDMNMLLTMRRLLYSFLSRGFEKEVDEKYFNDILSFSPVLKDIAKSTDDEIFKKGVEQLEIFLKDVPDNLNKKELIEELACNYTTLFLNVGAGNTVEHVYPNESVYLSADKLLYQEETEKVLIFYGENGFALNEDFKEPCDHIAAELSFLSSLSDKSVKALQDNKNKDVVKYLYIQKKFMMQHLLKWGHLFCTDLRNAAKTGFYSAIANITMGYLRLDFKSIDDLVAMINERK